MTDQPRQDYFEQVEQGLREAMRRGAHVRHGGRRRRLGRWTSGSDGAGAMASKAHMRRRVGAVLAAAACVATAAIVLLTVGLGAGTQQAFAGWSPTPTTPAKGQRAAAEASCRSRLPREPRLLESRRKPAAGRFGKLERRAIARERAHARLLRSDAAARRWHVVLVDTRGPYTVVMLARSGEQASCFIGPAPSTQAISVEVVQDAPEQLPTIRRGQIGELSFGDGRVALKPGASSYTIASGRTGAGVRAVTLVREGGSRVRATTAKGWFVAWWPGRRQAVAAEISTATGTTVRHLYNPLARHQRRHSR